MPKYEHEYEEQVISLGQIVDFSQLRIEDAIDNYEKDTIQYILTPGYPKAKIAIITSLRDFTFGCEVLFGSSFMFFLSYSHFKNFILLNKVDNSNSWFLTKPEFFEEE